MVAAVCAALQSQIMTDPAANSQGFESPESPVGNVALDVTVVDELMNAAFAVCDTARHMARADTPVGHRDTAILSKQIFTNVGLGNERRY